VDTYNNNTTLAYKPIVVYTRYMFCGDCGSRLINGDCNTCFKNKNALREFEEESDE
jgi:hypothetical protein